MGSCFCSGRMMASGAFLAKAGGHDGKVVHLDSLFPSLGSATGGVFDILDLLDGDIRIDGDLRAFLATASGSHQYDSGCQNKFVNLHIANNLKCALLI